MANTQHILHIIIQEQEDYIKLKLKEEEEEEKEIIALKNMHKLKFYKSLHEEVIKIAWHPNRYWNWCLTEDEKQEIEKLWYKHVFENVKAHSQKILYQERYLLKIGWWLVIFYVALTCRIPEEFAIYFKKSSRPSCRPCFKISSRCSCVILFIILFTLVRIEFFIAK